LDESENIEHILVHTGQNDGINKLKTQLQVFQERKEHKWTLQPQILIKDRIFSGWYAEIQLLVKNIKELIELEELKIFQSPSYKKPNCKI